MIHSYRKAFLVLLIIAGFYPLESFSQSCLPEGIYFETQNQIDSFHINYPGCSVIEGNVIIEGDDITSLEGLMGLNSINGSLTIGYAAPPYLGSNSSLLDLTGLDSLFSIQNNLGIFNNASLEDLTGLSNLHTVGNHMFIQCNQSLLNLNGLNELDSIGGSLFIGYYLDLVGNPVLNSLSGLNSLSFIGGDLEVCFNNDLESFSGLENLVSIDGSISIYGNYSLTTLSGMDNINAETITGFGAQSNDQLTFCAVQSVCDYLSLPNPNVGFINNSSGCNSIEEVEYACETISLEDKQLDELLNVFPNPSEREIHIQNNGNYDIRKISIINCYGQILIDVLEADRPIEVSNLSPGLYVIEFTLKETIVRKLFIVK